MAQAWFIGGGLLIALELIIPGGVLAPLGVAALVLGALQWAGIVPDWMTALTLWFILSIVLVIVFRVAFQRFMPGDWSRGRDDEDADAYDTVVEVTETIARGGEGRIAFRGSSWPAVCHDRTLRAGEKATLFYRDGVRWVVAPEAKTMAARALRRLRRPPADTLDRHL